MSLIRRRKPAEALAERLAAELVRAERHRLQGISTVAEAKREVRADIDRARQKYNDAVVRERRAEKALDAAVERALEAALMSRLEVGEVGAPRVVPIAPKPSTPIEVSFSTRGDGYRDAVRDEKPLRPASDIPAARGPVLRNRILVIAVWSVLVFRFAVALREHGPTGKGFLVGALSSLAILPIVIGAILLVVPDR